MLSQIEDGYQLETDALGANPVLRRLKDGEVIRPLSANANTVKALEKRGLIHATKGRDPLIIVWLLRLSYMRYALKEAADPHSLFERECEELRLSPRLKSLLEPFVPKNTAVSAEPLPT